MSVSRRTFLTGAAGAAVAAGAKWSGAAIPRPGLLPLPAPHHSGLDHIVVVLMENRSFDHYLGWLPGADGKQAGLSYADNDGVMHSTHHLTERQGCGFNDPDHSYAGGRVQYNNGLVDGFRKGSNDDFALGYYTANDLPFYAPLLREATTFDRYFCSILGPTFPNRFYTHAATTDRIDNNLSKATLPTIWDRLDAAGVSARYYFSDEPFLALWRKKYLPISRPVDAFFTAAKAGRLPSYSYLDPFFIGEDEGGSNDDHPHADIHRGQAFISKVARAVAESPLWSRTALVITYDEWGGFFDHVPPPLLPDDRVAGPGPDPNRAGFRVPCIVLSPFARRGFIGHEVYDHTSVLKMVEWRWGLKPLTRRDASARNLAETFNFANPRMSRPDLPTVRDPGPHLCGGPSVGMAAADPMWRGLATIAGEEGWH